MSAVTLSDTQRTVKRYIEPDLNGILTDDQLTDLGRIKIGLGKAEELIENVNALATETGLQLRRIEIYPLRLVSNDISILLFAHNSAEERIRAAAFNATELEAA